MDSEDLDRPLPGTPLPGRRSTIKWFLVAAGDFLNTVKAFIGTNYQALPFAFSQSGVALGIIGVVLIAVMTDHCCQLLIRSKHHLIRMLCDDEVKKGKMNQSEITALRRRLERVLGYGDIGRHVFGPACYHLIQIAVAFTQYATGIAYFIFIANTVYQIIPHSEVVNNTAIHNRSVSDRSEQAQGVPLLYLSNVLRYRRDVAQPDFLEDQFSFQSFYGDNISTISPDGSTISTAFFSSTDGSTTGTSAITSMVPDTTVAPDTTVEPNTTMSPNTTMAPNTTTPAPTLRPYTKPGVDLRYLFLIPLPFFLVMCLIKSVRLIAPFSTIATVALATGAISVLAYMLKDFTVCEDGFEWVKVWTLPVFIGQLTGAFEGIGCVVPIESSMEGNRRTFRWYLHFSIGIVACILVSYGTLGYLRYGDKVPQLIVETLPPGSMAVKFVDVMLIISVLFTFPLQTYPVIEVLESYIFGSGSCCCRPSGPRLEYDEIGSGIQHSEEQGLLTDASVESTASSVAFAVPNQQIPGWKRNILRLLTVLSICGFGIAMRDAYAYLGAFTGALGASLLAFVLPCMIHLRVRSHTMPWVLICKDIAIITIAVVASLLAVIVIIYRIATGQVAL